jgi:peptide/nickel transport system permease protein
MKEKVRKNGQAREVWRRLRKSRSAMLGLFIFSFFLFLAIFGTVLIPYSKSLDINVLERLEGPSAKHWFGTDGYGRDMLARCVHSARYSITIGIVTSMSAAVVGTILGALASYYGGWVDLLIMRLMDVLHAIPTLLLTLVVVATLGASVTNLIIAIAIANVPGFCRMSRSTMIGIGGQEYIEAAKAYGTSDARIMFKYILPNAVGPIIVTTTMAMAGALLAASSMSYLGLGIKPPTPECGGLLNAGKEWIRSKPLLLFFPGMCIVLASLGFNLLGDGLRDALDPKLKT